MTLALLLAATSCSTLTDDSSSTTRPLGFPTTEGPTTTLPEAARIPDSQAGDAVDLPAELAALAVPDWARTGRRTEAPEASISVVDFGAVPDDGQSDSAAFAAAVAEAAQRARTNQPTTVEVPAGRFLLTETLALESSVVLRGAGPDRTFVDIDLAGADAEGITMVGAPFGDGEWTAIGTTVERGDNRLPLDGSLALDIGQVVEIEQDNVDAMVSRPEWVVDWGAGASGMVAMVADAGSTVAVLDHGLTDTFSADRNARIRPISAIERSGVESMRIERLDTGYGHTIAMRYGYDLWVRDVELVMTTRAHVGLDVVGRCEVVGSQIHGAHDYGDGGRAYGISVARHTSHCRFEDNALWDLRHALIIQLGASGNVFAFNDARGSAGYDDRQPRADISLHGHWPQANLFEGNVVDRFVSADWWGPSGPSNVVWRGCVLDSMLIAESSDDQAVLASVIGPGGLTIDQTSTGTLAAANVVDGAATDDLVALTADLPLSLYGSTATPPTVSDCRVPASERNPWAQPGADRP